MFSKPFAVFTLAACLTLSACGNGDDDDTDQTANPPPPPPTAQRGDLIGTPTKVKSYSRDDLLLALAGNDVGKALLDLAVSPTCGVDVYQIQFQTVGGAGEFTASTGALMIPSGSDAATCQGARPIVAYAHGTNTDITYNVADLSKSDEGLAVATLFAAQGYIVIAPNYVGYNGSTLGYHPYLNADQQSKEMIDSITAGRTGLANTPTVSGNGKLFLTGYSQGGYVAMATHKAMQAAGSTVTASAPLSGPYALSAFGDAIFEGQVSASSVENLTLLLTSYQKAYGNIYTNTTDVFEAKYAPSIQGLLPSATATGDLVTQGKLPDNAVFNSTPPAPEFASYTPATAPTEFVPLFARAFGTDNLITNAYRLSYLQDAQTAPDGGFPTATDNLPPANPTHALRKALKTNDLRSWQPSTPTLLCGGAHDPTVYFFNTQLMQAYWTANVPGGAVTVVDIDSQGDPYSDLRDSFSAAKDAVRVAAVAGGATDNGDEAVLENYHAGLVAPFCLSAAKRFFDEH